MSDNPYVEGYEELIPVLGQMVIAWNATQVCLLDIFIKLSGMRWDKADAVYFALRTDAAQRDIIAALIPKSLADRKELAARLRKELADLGKLAGERNAAIHTIWAVDSSGPAVVAYRQHPRLKADFHEQFRSLMSRLDQVQERLETILDEI